MKRWLVVIALATAGACTLFDNDPPDDSCTLDTDCFKAQGEKCVDRKCQVVATDAGVDSP